MVIQRHSLGRIGMLFWSLMFCGLISPSWILSVEAYSTWPDVVFNNFPKSSWEDEMWWVCAPWGQSGTIVKDSIYLDGGLFQMAYVYSPGKSNETTRITHRPNDFLLKIDCSTSWTTDEVLVSAISKPGKILEDMVTRGMLFSDGERVYGAGGLSILTRGNYPISSSLIDSKELPEKKTSSLWQFDGVNTAWVDDESIALRRIIEGGYASDFAKRTGYSIGGVTKAPAQGQKSDTYDPVRDIVDYEKDSLSSFTYNNSVKYIPTVYEYNLTTKSLIALDGEGVTTKHTITPRAGNTIEHLPMGDKGVLMTLGGIEIGDDDELVSPISYDSIELFDTQTSIWYRQPTTGTPPPASISACTVLSELTTDPPTFVVYVYAHNNPSSSTENQSQPYMWALHLPSFHWTALSPPPSDLKPSPRDRPVCQLAANRHLIIIGGRSPNGDDCVNPKTKEPFRDKQSKFVNKYPFGVNTFIFDLVDLRWTDLYDAQAKAYEIPAAIKDDMKRNDINMKGPKAGWVSSQLMGAFERPRRKREDERSGGAGSDRFRSEDDEDRRGANKGKVAGGIIGGMIAVALVVWGWYKYRSRKEEAGATLPTTTAPGPRRVGNSKPQENFISQWKEGWAKVGEMKQKEKEDVMNGPLQ